MSDIQEIIYNIFHNNSIKLLDVQYYLLNKYENRSNTNLFNRETKESILLENIKKYSTFIYSNLLRLFLYDSQINEFYGFRSEFSKYLFYFVSK